MAGAIPDARDHASLTVSGGLPWPGGSHVADGGALALLSEELAYGYQLLADAPQLLGDQELGMQLRCREF